MDLRERIAAAIDAAEESHVLIAERFDVSVSTVERISRKMREGNSLEPAPKPGRPPRLDERHLARIREELERDPYILALDRVEDGLFGGKLCADRRSPTREVSTSRSSPRCESTASPRG